MARFLNTTATNFYLEELIKSASERLVLISPYLQLADRIKELLEDKNRLKLDVHLVYGKTQLQPEEITWLRELEFIRTSFCRNLHAKCYLNEQHCIITSLNLYEFSQVNNNEMGVRLSRANDPQAYKDAYEEARRIIRVSEHVRMSLEKVPQDGLAEPPAAPAPPDDDKLTTSKLAKAMGVKTSALLDALVSAGFLELRGTRHYITDPGKAAGGEFRAGKHGPYFLWPASLQTQLDTRSDPGATA